MDDNPLPSAVPVPPTPPPVVPQMAPASPVPNTDQTQVCNGFHPAECHYQQWQRRIKATKFKFLMYFLQY